MINNMGSEKYFDINAFLIHVLRHIGLWGSLIILFGVLGFVVSFVPDSRAYFNYTEGFAGSLDPVFFTHFTLARYHAKQSSFLSSIRMNRCHVSAP